MPGIPIPCAEAQRDHGITCEHETMPSGERRFRLLSQRDATAYIRTEAPPQGAWQQSHYHKKVKETFLVQTGWMGYAEERDGGEPVLFLCKEGDIFTTPPEVVHNVYMPEGAVIHTVKHGPALGEARLVDSRTKAFDAKTCDISEAELKRAVPIAQRSEVHKPPEPYSEAYRHFDALIWQVPAWATAIAAVIMAGVTQITKESAVLVLAGMQSAEFLAIACALSGFFFIVCSHALYRFRWHQVLTKTYTPELPLWSPQVYLQLLVNAEAFVLFFLAAQGTWQINWKTLAAVFLAISLLQEGRLIWLGRRDGKPVQTKS
ncbi:MAG: hypothetical protein HYU78_09345 [Rhodocyclales bacterium]|nr:hypothetical protein [Rhodocyclales bacterium]